MWRLTFSIFLLLFCPSLNAQLSAANFYQTIGPDIDRPKEWPAQLHLIPVPIDSEPLKLTLVGTWTVHLSCSGRPVDQARTLFTQVLDGYYRPSPAFTFSENSQYKRRLVPGRKQVDTYNVPNSESFGRYEIRIVNASNGEFIALLERFLPTPLRLVESKETGELILIAGSRYQLFGRQDPVSSVICQPGEELMEVLTRIPTS